MGEPLWAVLNLAALFGFAGGLDCLHTRRLEQQSLQTRAGSTISLFEAAVPHHSLVSLPPLSPTSSREAVSITIAAPTLPARTSPSSGMVSAAITAGEPVTATDSTLEVLVALVVSLTFALSCVVGVLGTLVTDHDDDEDTRRPVRPEEISRLATYEKFWAERFVVVRSQLLGTRHALEEAETRIGTLEKAKKAEEPAANTGTRATKAQCLSSQAPAQDFAKPDVARPEKIPSTGYQGEKPRVRFPPPPSTVCYYKPHANGTTYPCKNAAFGTCEGCPARYNAQNGHLVWDEIDEAVPYPYGGEGRDKSNRSTVEKRRKEFAKKQQLCVWCFCHQFPSRENKVYMTPAEQTREGIFRTYFEPGGRYGPQPHHR